MVHAVLVAVVASLVAAALLALAVGSPAYVLEVESGSSRTISYFNAAPEHEWAVERAVEAWNDSGAEVSLEPASRSDAELVLKAGAPAGGGLTTLIDRSALPLEHRIPKPGDAEILLPAFTGDEAQERRFEVALVAAHELGHVLGLGHEDGGCAAMNSTIVVDVPAQCERPPAQQWRCGLLEDDDVRGAVALYGGTVNRDRGPRVCDRFPPPTPPTSLRVSFDPARSSRVQLRWENGFGERLERVVISSSVGECPTRVRGRAVPSIPAEPGRPGAAALPLELRRVCYAIWSLDAFGRLSPRPATATFVPPPLPVAPVGIETTFASSSELGPRFTTIRWTNPEDPLLRRIVLVRQRGRCPDGPPRRSRSWQSLAAQSGAEQAFHDFRLDLDTSVGYCYALWPLDRFGRMGAPALVHVSLGVAQGAGLGAVPPAEDGY